MADLDFLVDYTSVKKANEEINRIGTTAQKSARVFEQAFNKVEAAQRKSLSSVRQQIDASQRLERQKQREAREAERAAQLSAKATRDQAREVDNLRSKYNPLFAASKLYETTQNEINRALSIGAITTRQAAAATEELTREFQEFQNGAAGFGNRFASATNLAGKGMNRLGVVAQQTGFQVGDFLVQIQSGANPLVAFGQQATQLAGILPLLAGSVGLTASTLLSLSVGLGIGIPLVTAIGAAFMRTKKSADDVGKAIDTVVSGLGDYESAARLANRTTKDLTEEFGSAATEMKNLAGFLKEVAVFRTLDSLTTSVAPFSSEIKEAAELAEKLNSEIERVGNPRPGEDRFALVSTLKERAEEAADAFGLIPKQIIQVQDALDQVTNSKSIVEIKDNALSALQSFEGMVFEGGKIPPEIARVVGELEKVLAAAARATAEVERTSDAAGSIGSSLQSAIDQANAFADAMARARGESLGIGISTTGINAQIAALRGGASQAEATATAAAVTLREELTTAVGGRVGRNTGARIEAQVAERFNKVLAQEQARGVLSSLTKTSGGSGGGGSNTEKDPREFLRSLEDELRLKGLLVGVNDRQAEQIKLEDQLKKNLLEAGQQVTEADRKRIEAIVASAEALREAEEAEERRKAMIERIEQSFGDAITSMVKGTESIQDAFLKMIGTIVEELFKAAVVDPITSGVGDFLGGLLNGGRAVPSAMGNAFSGGRVLPFANGGVVSSPTLFPLQGSQTGLMGEAGPEGILPLKRGRNGKLGVQADISGGENIVINQSFNFSANGDESVKRIIAAEAPKISQMTMKNIVEARQRGGTMKSVFSG